MTAAVAKLTLTNNFTQMCRSAAFKITDTVETIEDSSMVKMSTTEVQVDNSSIYKTKCILYNVSNLHRWYQWRIMNRVFFAHCRLIQSSNFTRRCRAASICDL